MIKFCASCKCECPEDATTCVDCGSDKFATSLTEIELMDQIAALEKEKAELCEKLAAAESAKAETEETVDEPDSTASSGLEFRLYDCYDGKESYSVKGLGTCKDNDIVIPSVYQGKLVTSIDDSAFQYCSCLKSVTVPANIKKIGAYAFRDCPKLKSIVFEHTSSWYDDRGDMVPTGILFNSKQAAKALKAKYRYGIKRK